MHDRLNTARGLDDPTAHDTTSVRPRLSVVPSIGPSPLSRPPLSRQPLSRPPLGRPAPSQPRKPSWAPLATTPTSDDDLRRRASLVGKRCLIVFASYQAKRPMYEKAKRLGLHLCALDGPGHWAKTAGELFDEFFEVDVRPGPRRLQRALDAVLASGLQFDAVTTFDEGGTTLAAELAEALGLRGHPIDAITTARDKLATRQRCQAAGLPSPRFASIRTAADLIAAAKHVGFPAVLKPASGVSSLYTHRVEGMADLRRCHAMIAEDAFRGSSRRALHSDDDPELIWAANGAMILEEMLIGEEFDVDCLLCDGRLVYAAVVRDLPQPHMKEVGQQSPPNFPEEAQRALVELAERSLAALGFRDGAFHVEAMYTADGPRLIEINGRIGGGPNRYLHELVWGVDLVEQDLMRKFGLPIQPHKAERPRAYVLTSDLPAPKSGTVLSDRFLDHLAGHPAVLDYHPRVTAGQRVNGPEAGSPDWLGEIIVQGQSVADAERIMAEILETVHVEIVEGASVHVRAASL